MSLYLSLDIICSSKLTVFLELRSPRTVRFLEQLTSVENCPTIFSRQMEVTELYIEKTRTYTVTTDKTKHFNVTLDLQIIYMINKKQKWYWGVLPTQIT